MSENEYYLGFSVFSGIGPVKFKKLLETFETAKGAWEASNLDLGPVIGEVWTARFDDFRKKFSIEEYVQRLQKEKIAFVAFFEETYPDLLKQIKTPPIGLFVRGNIQTLYSSSEAQAESRSSRQARTIAVVGTRKTTSYGKEVTELLTEELVGFGFTVVSGLALGVDTVAHVTTLKNNGKTIAVLGCGVDCCLPRENQPLYNSIVESGGAVISELPLSHPPTTGSFPSRNRIIAGLALATLVTEGAQDSGALYTANYAFQYNRKVFAIPGPITSLMSKGPNSLFEKGAKLVTNAKDILNYLNVHNKSNGQQIKSIVFESKEEETIGNLLATESLTFDELVRKTGIVSAWLGTILSMMEIKGIVKSAAMGKYSIAS